MGAFDVPGHNRFALIFSIVAKALMRRRHGRAFAVFAARPPSNHAPCRPKNARKPHPQRHPLRWFSNDAANPPIERRPQRADAIELQGKHYI
jgi:hypothetical protein